MLAKQLSGAAAAAVPAYIEDVFSTWLYTGNGSTQTITNGIDLAGKGGMVWIKSRSSALDHALQDTARGISNVLESNTTDAQLSAAAVSPVTSTGFVVNNSTYSNTSGETYASWTFRKQAKFFDVVTYTGTGANRTVAHNLGSVPGCIIVKRTNATGDWQVYHRSLANTEYMVLNSTAAKATGTTRWNSTTPTSTVFSLGTDATVNASGGTYVAYLFAHNAGGFGLTGTDNVISCGSYTGNGSATGPTVTLGYEPQWLMIKNTSGTGNWNIFDSMRGLTVSGQNDAYLEANTSDAEASVNWVEPNATGFQITTTSSELNTNASTYIYIAIRRGPMKTPTTGTSVFAPTFASSSGQYTATAGFPVDTAWYNSRVGSGTFDFDRLRGTPFLGIQSTSAEVASNGQFDSNVNFRVSATGNYSTWINWLFRRAPGFFDVVCYTGNSSGNRQVPHNLTVSPGLLIVKSRNAAGDWYVLCSSISTQFGKLNTTDPFTSSFKTDYFGGDPTSTYFVTGSGGGLNGSGQTYVAYLFASCPGVSKVGSYTGSGTTKQIDCGFTGGARFVLIKRTDSTGDWYVWDSARGIVAGNDPYLLLNSAAAEVTSTDYIDTYSAGFEISSTAPAAINANGGTFVFLAVA